MNLINQNFFKSTTVAAADVQTAFTCLITTETATQREQASIEASFILMALLDLMGVRQLLGCCSIHALSLSLSFFFALWPFI